MTTSTARPGNRLRRTFAGTVTTALATATLALVPASAQAADPVPEPTLTWKISQQFVDHLSSRALTGDVAFDPATGFTFGGGEGTFNASTGVTDMQYDGTVRGAFAFGGNEFYSVTVADPAVTVDAAGEGTITAVVSASNAAQGATPPASTTPRRVVVTTFDAAASDWTVAGGLESLVGTPDWDGVLPPGSPRATELGLSPTQPVEGRSFAPTFLDQITPGVRAHFFDSGTGSSNPKKNPAPFTATAPVPVATITSAEIVEQTPTSLKVAVSGINYKPGSPGIYVSVGKTGSTDVVNPGAYLGTVWSANPANPDSAVRPDGSFSTTLSLDADAVRQLDPDTSYSVITFKAHGQAASDPSQTASVPLDIDFDELSAPVSISDKVTKKPTTKKSGTIAITVSSKATSLKPAGKVKVSFKKSGQKTVTTGTGTLKNGVRSLTAPKLKKKGTWKIYVTYTADPGFTSVSGKYVGTVKVTK